MRLKAVAIAIAALSVALSAAHAQTPRRVPMSVAQRVTSSCPPSPPGDCSVARLIVRRAGDRFWFRIADDNPCGFRRPETHMLIRGDTLRLWFRLLDRPVMATCPGLIHVEAWHGTFRSQDTLPHIATLFVGPPPSSAARATADAPIASTRILVRERTHLGDSLLRHARRGHPEAIPATLRGPLAMFASSRAATTFSCEHIDDSEQPRVRFECQREPGESGRWEAFTMAATGEVLSYQASWQPRVVGRDSTFKLIRDSLNVSFGWGLQCHSTHVRDRWEWLDSTWVARIQRADSVPTTQGAMPALSLFARLRPAGAFQRCED